MTTTLLFREDPYLDRCEAQVTEILPEGGIILDRTIFYASGGGQPGDVGTLMTTDGRTVGVTTAVWADSAKTRIAHIVEGPIALAAGERVTLALDWSIRHRRMRMHTALHLLSVALPYPVTGGSVGEEEGRLDFDIPDAGAADKDALTAELARMVARDAAIRERWITDAELDANPGLVKTMSVAPPRGSGRVRLVEIDGLDLQPCGGTHVRSTGEIGAVVVTRIEKKGKQNRRVRLAWA